MKTTSKLIIFFITFLALAAHAAPAQSPREELNQMVQQLQKAPGDNALREKVIVLAAQLKPAPAVPPDARRPFVMAVTYQKEATKPADFGMAIDAYREALKVAPWWGDAYYNMGVALESAGRLGEAREALQLYLLTRPKDAEAVQDRLFALEAKANLATRQQAEKARQQAEKARTLIIPGVGVGPLRVGMSDTEAVAAMGPATDRSEYDNHNGYRGVDLKWGVDPATIYMKFHRYQRSKSISISQKQYATAKGVSPGMPVSEALSILGAPMRSKDYGRITEVCFADGLIVGFGNGSTTVSHMAVFAPSDVEAMCPR